MPLSLHQVEEYASDLAPFADLGTDAPRISEASTGFSISLVRHGEPTELQFSRDEGALLEVAGASETKHAGFRALLASDRFGSLRDWATKQRTFLVSELPSESQAIRVTGRLNGGIDTYTRTELDDILVGPQQPNSTRVLLIDGPAGIGKTHFIASLAAARANEFVTKRRPLILHVQSRGRTLSYLYDLIAYSLQRLRLEVTYDQVPILAKYGLVTIAIDGFDELADPDGYDKAWSQVSELVENLRGSGAIILAGRETFIGRDRIRREIASITDEDEVSVFTLQSPSKGEAIDWLYQRGWSEAQISTIESFLEPNSLALRPFFLMTLADPAISQSLSQSSSTSVLAILMEAMVEREITKFGEAIEAELAPDELRAYVRNLMGEVAREMAENSVVSISDASLSWMVEVALPVEIGEAERRILKARAHALGFLTNDDRPGYRRFFHDKFYEYFLSTELISTVARSEISKTISRGLLGSSLLETFGTVLYTGTDSSTAAEFIEQALALVREYPPVDRTRRNLGALLIASLPAADMVPVFELCQVDVDEARAMGTAAAATATGLIVSQLDARGADLSHVEFNDCIIYTLIADGALLLPSSFPIPTRIQDVSLNSGIISRPDEAEEWVKKHLCNPPEEDTGLLPNSLRDHDAVHLLSKACRMRQHWLRGGGDDLHAARILEADWWPTIERVLDENGLVRIESRDASGTKARFIHIRKPDAILAEDSSDPEVVSFYSQLRRELTAQ
jgi:hypothetical protein